jgi:hypothetical protein
MEEVGKGSPLALRFSSCARLVHSSMSLACTTSSTIVRRRGGAFSLPLYTYAHELMCVFASCCIKMMENDVFHVKAHRDLVSLHS